MNFLKSLYTSSPSINIKLESNNHNYFKYITKENKILSYPTYYDKDEIFGIIKLILNNNKLIIIESMNIYLFGILQNQNSNISEKIFEDSIQISSPDQPQSIINEITDFKFSFKPKNKPYETYFGESIQIKYFLKVIADIKREQDLSEKLESQIEICCLKPATKKICDEYYLDKKNNKELEINIGVENVIHVNIKLLKTRYCLDDVVIGKIKIVKNELNLNNIFLEIKREEKINIGDTNLANIQDLAKYELVEGYPEEGDEMCFRYYLSGVKNLTPSYYNDNEKEKKFEVRYFLSFEFNDNKGYQFFKNVEIIIYRMNLNNLISPNENKDKDKDKDKNKNKNAEIFMSIKNQLNSK